MRQVIAVIAVLGLILQFLPSRVVLAHDDREETILVCHRTPGQSGSSDQFSTKQVKKTELNGHIKHGDTQGACPSDDASGRRITVSGYKFNDINGDGIWGRGEPALPGWTIYAHKGAEKSNEVLASDITDKNGYYKLQFQAWSSTQSTYIAEQLKDGWKQTIPGMHSNYQYQLGSQNDEKFANVNFGNQVNENCDGSELVMNGGFEKPVVKSTQKWDAFLNGTIGLVWKVFRKDGSTSSKGLELQRGYSGWLSDEGSQYAELDAYHPVRITQDIDTIPGQTYKVSFAFSARPDTPANDNAVDVSWGNNPIAAVAAESTVTNQTNWMTYSYWVPATSEMTTLTFADAGITPNSLGTFLDDVSVKCTSENGRVFTGGKFEDANGDGLWGDGEVGLANWGVYAVKPTASFKVDPAQGAVASPVLNAGKNYLVQVKGTYQVGADITADAMYSVKSPNTLWTDAVQSYAVSGPTLLDLQINGVSPFWGEYNDAHTYFTSITGSGVSETFSVKDTIPFSKTGELTISVFEVVNTTVTDATGHYVLEATGWDGVQPIMIVENSWQPGWGQTYPGAASGAVHLVTWEEAWSQNWAYNFGNQQVVHQELPPEEPPEEPPQTQTGTLSMVVTVVNDNGGVKTESDFSIDVTDVTHLQTIPASATVANLQVEGAYATTLVGATDGYVVTYSTECNDTMPVGGSKACIVTLDDMDVFSITAPVAPTVACVNNAGEGKLAAHFGYINLNAGPVLIPAGTFDNRITGGGLVGSNQGQPSFFEPGFVEDAFQVVFDTAIPVVWTINTPVGEFSIEANNLTDQCANIAP